MTTAQEKAKFPLDSIGAQRNLIKEIFRKMSWKTYCRLRQTCTFMDDLAEDTGRIPNFLVELHVYRYNMEIRKIKEGTSDTRLQILDRKISIVPQLSGFTVGELILIQKPDEDLEAELISLRCPQTKPHLRTGLHARRHHLDKMPIDYAENEKARGTVLGVFERLSQDGTSLAKVSPAFTDVITALLTDWVDGLNMGKCIYVSVQFQCYEREHNVIVENMKMDLKFQATTRDVTVDKKFIDMNAVLPYNAMRTTKFDVNIYKIRRSNGDTAAVLMNAPRQYEQFHFAFIPNFEDYFLYCDRYPKNH